MQTDNKDFAINDDNILYEDSHLIVVVKPAGIAVQGDKSGDKSMYDYIKDYIKHKYNKPGNVYLGIVHRLDRPVSGVMVFAKTSKAASRLSEAIRTNKFDKYYYAVVNGITESSDRLVHYVIKRSNKLGNIASVVFENSPNSKKAILDYKTLESLNHQNLSLLEVKLETGRFHQIRVQLSAIGHPIYGDRKYGSYIKYDRNDVPLALFASKLSFEHPTQKHILTFESKPTDFKPWNYFNF